MLDTWAMRRRRRMCGYVFSRVVLGKDVDDAENLRAIEAGALGSTVKIRDSIQHKLDFATLGITPPFPTALPGDPGYEEDAELLCQPVRGEG